MGLQEILDMVGRTPAGVAVARRPVEEALGVALPADFRALAEAFPPGQFQTFLRILHPAESRSPADYRAVIAGYADVLRDQPAAGAVYPEKGGLMPWGVVGLSPVLCWLTEDDDPERWPVVVCGNGDDQWRRYDMSATEFVTAVLTEPATVPELAHVTSAVRPPVFVPLKGFETPADVPDRPTGEYWVTGTEPDMIEPSDAVAELAVLLEPAPIPGFALHEFLGKMKRHLPGDFCDLVRQYGAVSIGPARVNAPDGSATDFFTELRAFSKRAKALRRAGGGPQGTVHPEYEGLILWGRLDDGGYLCWAPASAHGGWPVVALDASMRGFVTHRMSATRFLLELATNPAAVLLPPPA
ncbi:hypothetical protein AB0M02_28680 [Actinoplanes sp. NPDC051861]|uniref:hypothetical protein n=1 Tax=Actinoplanes sp. NPDC051861 TaxID=3155170 RepID=UPI003414E3D8